MGDQTDFLWHSYPSVSHKKNKHDYLSRKDYDYIIKKNSFNYYCILDDDFKKI